VVITVVVSKMSNNAFLAFILTVLLKILMQHVDKRATIIAQFVWLKDLVQHHAS
jgi:hypothetical protein